LLLPGSFLFTRRKDLSLARDIAPELAGDTYWSEIFPIGANSADETADVSPVATDRGAFYSLGFISRL
jgi:hypothetical protein